MHGNITSYLVAYVTHELDRWTKEVSVAVLNLPDDLLIGCDDYLSVAGVMPGNTSLAVMTRQKCYQEGGGDGVAKNLEGLGVNTIPQDFNWHPLAKPHTS